MHMNLACYQMYKHLPHSHNMSSTNTTNSLRRQSMCLRSSHLHRHRQNLKYRLRLSHPRQNGMHLSRLLNNPTKLLVSDASREPPPLNTKPEGIALAKKTYAMSQDEQLFQPPQSYPEAPKNMYYDVPSTKPEPEKLAQVFPWESHAPRPTRVFPEDDQSSTTFTLPKSFIESTEDESGPSLDSRVTSWTSEEPTESWDTYSRSNAWDEIPEIQRYIQSIQQTRKGRVQVLTGGPSSTGQSLVSGQERYNFSWSNNTRVTDFPSEQERPSLPVTPAPIRRKPPIPGEEDFDTGLLPPAHGVPNQEDWVGITVDIFLHLLRATYLYWRFTEPYSRPRGPSSTSVRSDGKSRFAV